MAYKIIPESCKNCGTCAENCPATAISQETNYYVINPDECMVCGLCVDNCKYGAIVED